MLTAIFHSLIQLVAGFSSTNFRKYNIKCVYTPLAIKHFKAIKIENLNVYIYVFKTNIMKHRGGVQFHALHRVP